MINIKAKSHMQTTFTSLKISLIKEGDTNVQRVGF